MPRMIEPIAANFRHLRALAAIADHGTMSAASGAIGLSQPALAQGLAKLERQFGASLFERAAHGMRPTQEGSLVIERVQAAFGGIEAALRALPATGRRGSARLENRLTGTHVRALLSLTEGQGFLGAARATGASQPALHRAVRELEALCGLKLATRQGQRVKLTGQGQKLARAFRLAAAELRAAQEDLTPRLGRRVAIGAMPLSRARLLPAAMARMQLLYPAFGFEIVEGSYGELIEPLRDGQIEMVLGALRLPCPNGLEQTILCEDRLAIIGRRGHPLAQPGSAGLDALARYPWIIGPSGSPLRLQWEQLFAGRALPPSPIVCGSVMTIRGVLEETDHLTLLSPTQVALEITAGRLAVIASDGRPQSRVIGMISRAGWRPTVLQARFAAMLRDVAAEQRLPAFE